LGGSRVLTQRLIFVVIALAFVGSGYLIGRYFLASLLGTPSDGEPVTGTNPPASGKTATVQVQTKPVSLYRVQIGAFSTKEGADRVVEAVLAKGVGAAVATPDPLYKVYCGAALTKEAGDKLSQSARTKLAGSVIGKDDALYVAGVTIASRSLTLTGDKAVADKLQSAFTKADNAVQSLLSFWDSQYLGRQNAVDLSAMETDLTAVKDDLSKVTPKDALVAPHGAALKIISDLTAAVKGAKEAAGGDSTKAASGASALIVAIDSYASELKKLSP
jgi:hypothetical protein